MSVIVSVEPVRIAIVSDNPNMSTVQMTMLRAADLRHMTRFDNSDALLAGLRHFTYDLIIVNDLGAIDPVRIAQIIRDEVNCQDPFSMTLLVTSKTTRSKVRTAICMGYDDLLTMPFSSGAMLNKIKSLSRIERRFVRVGGYFGPDRRRVDEGPPVGVGERRVSAEQQGQVIECTTSDRTKKIMDDIPDNVATRPL